MNTELTSGAGQCENDQGPREAREFALRLDPRPDRALAHGFDSILFVLSNRGYGAEVVTARRWLSDEERKAPRPPDFEAIPAAVAPEQDAPHDHDD